MKLSSSVNVLLFNFFSAIVDRHTGAAVAPDNRTVTSPEQSSLSASPVSPSPTGFGTSRFGTNYNCILKLDIRTLKTHLCLFVQTVSLKFSTK